MGKRRRGWLLLCCLLAVLLCGSAGALGAPAGGDQNGAQEGAALTWADEVKGLDQAPEGYQEDLDNNVVSIFDAQGLAWFAYQVNEGGRTFAGITVELAGDIDLAGKQWVPVGNSRFYPSAGSSLASARFSGVFEGNGHRISGMTINGYQDPYGELAGLFGHTVDAVIQNVTLEDAAIVLDLQDRPTAETGARIRTAGLLASWIVSTEIENVTVSGSLSVTLAERFVFSGFGGLVGLADCAMNQKDSVPIPQEGSAIRHCQAAQVAITYTGSSGELFPTPVGFGGLVGAQGVLYGADIFFGSGGGAVNTSLPTTIDSCQVNQLAVTRQASDGSVHEGIGGVIGVARGQVQLTDCQVTGFQADIAATMPVHVKDTIVSGLYLGGIAGIFDGGSSMLRCAVWGDVVSDVTAVSGGFADSSEKSGGFYGGLAGMLGYPPEVGDIGFGITGAQYDGLGASIKSCYTAMTFDTAAAESVRHISSLRSIKKEGTLDVSHVICQVEPVNVAYTDKWVCGWLYGGNGNKSTNYYQLHPVESNLLYAGEAQEPFCYTYETPYGQVLDSISDLGGGYWDKIADWQRTYTVANPADVLLAGQGTSQLTFAKEGVYDVTVELTDPADPGVRLVFTLPVTVSQRPVDLSGALTLRHQVGTEGPWEQDDLQAHVLRAAAEPLAYDVCFDFTKMILGNDDEFQDAAEVWEYYCRYYSYFTGTVLTLELTFDPAFTPTADWNQLVLESNVLTLDPASPPSYDQDTHRLTLRCLLTTAKVEDPNPAVAVKGITGVFSDEAQQRLVQGQTLSLVTQGTLSGFLEPEYANLYLVCQDSDTLSAQLQCWQVAYDLAGGKSAAGVDYQKETFVDGSTVTVKASPSRSGYRFTGWSDGQKVYQPGDTFSLTNHVTLTAQWRRTGGGGATTAYDTLTYVSNGGTAYPSEQYARGTLVELTKIPRREQFIFTGWYQDESCSQKISEIQMNGDQTVYAGWRQSSVPEQLNGQDHIAYIIGYPDGAVQPQASISRAEAAAVFFRLLKEETRQQALTWESSFADVSPGQWYTAAVATMAELGVIEGRGGRSFVPDAPITRGELAAICARFDSDSSVSGQSFTDTAGHWAAAEIQRASGLGWMEGYPDGSFRPDQAISRAEAMTMINRVLQRQPQGPEDLLPEMRQWSDNQDPEAWYYLAIQEATNSHAYTAKDASYESWTKLLQEPDWRQYQ